MLTLQLLGGCQITLDDKPIDNLGNRKAQALFVYLIVSEKPVSRDVLTALFWPEMAERAAKNNLRTTLAGLKKYLGAYLDITTASIGFNRQLPYQLDVELLYNAIETAISTHDLTALQAAVHHYRGEFLKGFHLHNTNFFEEWLLQQREQLRYLVMRALEILLKRAIKQGEYQIGLQAGHKLLAIEPSAETAHRQLMLLFALSGQRGRALKQYELCCRLLAEELDIQPMVETTALYQKIRAGELVEASALEESIPSALPSELPLLSKRPIHLPPATTKRSEHVAVPNNLNKNLATFIGRQKELAFLIQQLTGSDCRILSVLGPGGIGKSSLCLEVGQRLLEAAASPFPDGIFFVQLAGVTVNRHTTHLSATTDWRGDESPIIHAIAQTIGCQFQGDRPLQAQLIDYLQHRRLLLILDNFEQMVEDAGLVAHLLEHAPTVAALVTSRARLDVHGEVTLMLNGLSISSSPNEPLHNDVPGRQNDVEQAGEAVALFVARAQNLNPSFELNAETVVPITQICRAVGGLPLAIEMTAAWLNIYSCAEIAERLAAERKPVELLTSQFQDQPERHQNLQTVFDDSWSLLPPDMQWSLAKLSVFSSQFTRAAAQAVANLTPKAIMFLRNHSLLHVNDEYHYSLHPLIRQFAAGKWQTLTQQQPDARTRLCNAHSDYYLQQVADLKERPTGKEEFALVHLLKKNHAEVVRSWQWAVQQQALPQIQQAMGGLFRYLELTSQSIEGKLLFGMITGDACNPVSHWLQIAHCHFMRRLAEHDAARQQLEAIVSMMHPVAVNSETANESLGAETDGNLVLQSYSFAQCVLGWINYEQGTYELAQSCFLNAQAQSERTGDLGHLMEAHNGLGAVAFSSKEYDSACAHYKAALALAEQQADLHYTAIVLGNLAAHAQATRAYTKAEQYLQMRLEIDGKTQNVRQMAISHQRLGQLAHTVNDYAKAESHLRQSLNLFRELGNSPEISHVLLDLSQCLLRQRQVKEAETQCLLSLRWAVHAQMAPRILAALTLLAEIWMAEEKKEDAITLLQVVNRNAQMPAATWRRARKLQDALVAEFGEKSFAPNRQAVAQQTLQDFGAQLLIQNRANQLPRLMSHS